MKNTSGVALLFFLALIIALFQVMQSRHVLPLRAAATPSVTATSFLVAATSPTATITETPALPVFATLTVSSTLPSELPPFSPTPTTSPTETPTLLSDVFGNCPPVTHHNAFILPADHQNDRAWITNAIVHHLNSGGDPYRIVDSFRLLGRDAFVRFADLERDGIKELLMQVTVFPSEGRRSYLGFLDCANGQVAQLSWFAETDMKYEGLRLEDVRDLDGDGIKEIISVSERATGEDESSCQIKVMIYWANLQRPEALEGAFPPREACSYALQVTDESEILLYNSPWEPTEVARYQWDSDSQSLRLIGIEPTGVKEPVLQNTNLPALPSLLPPNLQALPHCPPIQTIGDFWLVPTLQEFASSPQMILDFDDEQKGVTPQLLAYLNAGGDPDELFLALARHHQASDLRKVDLNGDGVNEVLIKIHDGSYQGTNRIGLFFCTSQGTYELEKWLIRGTDFGYGYSDIVAIEDFNQDGYPEVLIEDIPLMSSCYRERHLLGWDGNQLSRNLIEDGGNQCDTTLTITDLDQDGYDEWVIRGNDDRWRFDWRRNATWVYKLKPISEIDPLLKQDSSYYEKLPDDGLVYVLDSKVLDEPTDRIHVLEDAFTAFENSDLQLAIALYEQAVTDQRLSYQSEIEDLSRQLQGNEISDSEREIHYTWYEVLVEQEPYTLAFAYLRLIMLHIATGDISQADYWLNQMVVRFPDGSEGSQLRSLAQLFIERWRETKDITLVCTAVNAEYDTKYQRLGWDIYTVSGSQYYIGWTPMCPFME